MGKPWHECGMRFLVIAVALILAAPEVRGTARAGWLDKAINSTVKGVGEGVKDAAKNPPKKAPSPEPSDAQADEGSAPSGSQSGEPAAASAGAGTESQAATGSSPGPAGASGADIASAEVAYARYDFVPGDKVILWDDFSETDPGEFPRKWSLKCEVDGGSGYGGGQTVEVVEYQGRRFLAVQPSSGDAYQHDAGLCVRWKVKTEMPEKFTVEFDAVLGLADQDNRDSMSEYTLHLGESTVLVDSHEVKTENTELKIGKYDGKVYHVAVAVNGTSVKVYLNNERIANDPDGAKPPITRIGMELGSNGHHHERVMFTNFRLAEGGKDIKSVLEAEGKIVTHGILFDSGSDKIKPESFPTLKKILALLEGDSGLKFSIEGHTDSQGKKDVNQPLSERRAAAVKVWLEGKGIAAARLQAKGWGDTKPIDANDTAEGRANNRRVEFVKI